LQPILEIIRRLDKEALSHRPGVRGKGRHKPQTAHLSTPTCTPRRFAARTVLESCRKAKAKKCFFTGKINNFHLIAECRDGPQGRVSIALK